jgi:hypothetical protein
VNFQEERMELGEEGMELGEEGMELCAPSIVRTLHNGWENMKPAAMQIP